MAIPNTVQRQLEAAEKLALNAATQATAQPALLTDPSQMPATPAPAAAPAEPPAPAPAPAAPAENYEHKFRTLQGMYSTEVPALRAANKTMESQVIALTEQVRALTQAMAKPSTPPEADPRDTQQFGEDMVEMVRKYAQQAYTAIQAEFGEHARKLDGRVAELEAKLSGVTKKTEQSLEASFYTVLNDQVPDWQQINVSERWLRWLDTVDPVYGAARQVALDAAHERLDAKRVVAIFKQFLSETKSAGPSLESQVQPAPGGAAAAPSAPAQKPMLSSKFITTFFNDVAKGKYRGREQEAARLEAEIDLAAAEGRIV